MKICYNPYDKEIILDLDLSIDKKFVRKASIYGSSDREIFYRQRRKKYKELKKMSTLSSLKDRTDSTVKEPEQYNVIMHNDDFTSMEFVVRVLTDIFHKDAVTAEALMMRVHTVGRAVIGKYPYDIAVTRVKKALTQAREQGFPFRMTIEEA